MLIHIPYVRLTEISTVKDKPNIFISISLSLGQHALQLGHIVYASRIILIKQRLLVIMVICYGIVEYRFSLFILLMSYLREFNITGLYMLICGVIGNIYGLLMFPAFIPPVQEFYPLIRS